MVSEETLGRVLLAAGRLTDEQHHLVRQLCTSGNRVQCAIGRAGAGKTTTMRAAAAAWEAEGFRVIGSAVKGEAARNLADGAGIPTETVAWFLARRDAPGPPRSVSEPSSSSTRRRPCPTVTSTPCCHWRSGPGGRAAYRRPRTARRRRGRWHVPTPLRVPPDRDAGAGDHTPDDRPGRPCGGGGAAGRADRRRPRATWRRRVTSTSSTTTSASTSGCSAAGGTPAARATRTPWSIAAIEPGTN